MTIIAESEQQAMPANQIAILFRRLLENAATLKFSMRRSDESSKQVLTQLVKQKEAIRKLGEKQSELFGYSYDLFMFPNPYSGELHPFHSTKTSIDEHITRIHILKNRQYQCILSEAYELFEDYVIGIYEVCRGEVEGFKINSDKGAMPTLELKKHTPAILTRFRETVSAIKHDETNNILQTNFRLHVNMIEKFRHKIVHRNGQAGDVAGLVEAILKKSNLASDKARRPDAELIIGSYIAKPPYGGVVLLVEQPQFQLGGLTGHINRCEHLIDTLLGYALIMSKSTVEHFKFPISKIEAGDVA